MRLNSLRSDFGQPLIDEDRRPDIFPSLVHPAHFVEFFAAIA
jgi:hypothetical protein